MTNVTRKGNWDDVDLILHGTLPSRWHQSLPSSRDVAHCHKVSLSAPGKSSGVCDSNKRQPSFLISILFLLLTGECWDAWREHGRRRLKTGRWTALSRPLWLILQLTVFLTWSLFLRRHSGNVLEKHFVLCLKWAHISEDGVTAVYKFLETAGEFSPECSLSFPF